MDLNTAQIFSIFGFFIILLFIIGTYCLVVTRNMLRAVIALEILIKAVTLLLIAVGYMTGNVALAQSLVITIIVIEVVIVVIAGGLALNVFRHNDDLDVRRLQNLKG